VRIQGLVWGKKSNWAGQGLHVKGQKGEVSKGPEARAREKKKLGNEHGAVNAKRVRRANRKRVRPTRAGMPKTGKNRATGVKKGQKKETSLSERKTMAQGKRGLHKTEEFLEGKDHSKKPTRAVRAGVLRGREGPTGR